MFEKSRVHTCLDIKTSRITSGLHRCGALAPTSSAVEGALGPTTSNGEVGPTTKTTRHHVRQIDKMFTLHKIQPTSQRRTSLKKVTERHKTGKTNHNRFKCPNWLTWELHPATATELPTSVVCHVSFTRCDTCRWAWTSKSSVGRNLSRPAR